VPGPLTPDEARDALDAWVRTTRWRRRDVAKALAIESLEHSGAEHVIFQSFVERRTTVQAHDPHRGGDVDGPERGAAPEAWAMPLAAPATWTDARGSCEVPHTAVVRACHGCGGSGHVACSACGGTGTVTCGSCGGSGTITTTQTVTHTDANGMTTTTTEQHTQSCSCLIGHVTCSSCSGGGRHTCSTCSGARALKHYVRLDVVWRTHTTDAILEKTDLPDHLVREADGVLEYGEEEDRIEPRVGGGGGPFRGGETRVNEEVNAAANALIAGHAFGPEERVHRQRLVVRGIPVHEARYRWGRRTLRYWVYGLQRRVHAPDFPVSLSRVGLVILAVVAVVGLLAGGVAYALATRG
jgi:hypothetical protein